MREALIRSEREWNDQVEGWGLAAPSRSLLDALTAGEAVVVPAWQVSEFLPVLLWRWQERWGRDIRVERDGSIVPVRPIRDPNRPLHVAGWEPVPAPGRYEKG